MPPARPSSPDPRAGSLGSRGARRPVSGLPRAAGPIIGADHEAPRPVAPKEGRFTTMIPGWPTTPPFSPMSQAPYLRFCKRKMKRARGLSIRRSKPA